MLLITLDETRKEQNREEKKKGFIPRNGWQRGYDGNFYRIINDPRCISEVEYLENAEKLKKENEEKEKREKDRAKNSERQIQHFNKKYTQIIRLEGQKKFFLSEFKAGVNWRCMVSGLGGRTEFEKASLKSYIKIPHIPEMAEFDKIEILEKSNIVKFWLKGNKQWPDYVLAQGLIIEEDYARKT